MRKVVLVSVLAVMGAVVASSQAVPGSGPIVYIDDHFETGTLEGWTPYGGPRVADRFLFNDPYSPPGGEHWGVGQDAWGGTVSGGIYKRFYDHYLPNEIKYFEALVEAFSVDWNFNPTPGHVNIRIGKDPTGGTDPAAPSVIWSPWYWGDWAVLKIEQPCIEGWETVFVDWFAPWATGPMVAKVDWVRVWQTPEPASLLLLALGVPLIRRRRSA